MPRITRRIPRFARCAIAAIATATAGTQMAVAGQPGSAYPGNTSFTPIFTIGVGANFIATGTSIDWSAPNGGEGPGLLIPDGNYGDLPYCLGGVGGFQVTDYGSGPAGYSSTWNTSITNSNVTFEADNFAPSNTSGGLSVDSPPSTPSRCSSTRAT